MSPLHPTVPVEINGKTYPLRYEFRDYAKAEGRLRMALLGPRSAEFWASEGSAYQTSVLLFVGLMNCEKQVLRDLYGMKATPIALSLDDVMGMFDYENAPAIETAVADALAVFMPQLKEAAATAPPLAETPSETVTTGTTSTPSLAPASA